MNMPTILFDFDSTLVSIETLDEILSQNLSEQEAQQIKHITRQGMNGELSFAESLEKRLQIAQPMLHQLKQFGEEAVAHITPKMAELISHLNKENRCCIVSGGFKEVIQPVAEALGISDENIHAVTANWSSTGNFIQLDPKNAFCESKVKGLRELEISWELPTISVGDGITDYQLYENNLVNAFIAYTQFQKRAFVDELGLAQANNVDDLAQLIEEFIGQYSS